jgi:peptidylprolyl isomerase
MIQQIPLLVAALTLCSTQAFQGATWGQRARVNNVLRMSEAAAEDPFESYMSGSPLAWKDLTVGEGEPVAQGDVLTVSYVGKIFTTRKRFEKSPKLNFKLGDGAVMPGLEKGVEGMKTGGKRVIRIPSVLAYGEKGARNVIPPNTDLEFEIEVEKISRGIFETNLTMIGENRAIGFVALFILAGLAPMIGIGERGLF